jgi:hypothetical protein
LHFDLNNTEDCVRKFTMCESALFFSSPTHILSNCLPGRVLFRRHSKSRLGWINTDAGIMQRQYLLHQKMHLAAQFLLALLVLASKGSCHQQQLPNYFTMNNRYNTPYGECKHNCFFLTHGTQCVNAFSISLKRCIL